LPLPLPLALSVVLPSFALTPPANETDRLSMDPSQLGTGMNATSSKRARPRAGWLWRRSLFVLALGRVVQIELLVLVVDTWPEIPLVEWAIHYRLTSFSASQLLLANATMFESCFQVRTATLSAKM
jgi:hypothetical protein